MKFKCNNSVFFCQTSHRFTSFFNINDQACLPFYGIQHVYYSLRLSHILNCVLCFYEEIKSKCRFFFQNGFFGHVFNSISRYICHGNDFFFTANRFFTGKSIKKISTSKENSNNFLSRRAVNDLDFKINRNKNTLILTVNSLAKIKIPQLGAFFIESFDCTMFSIESSGE